MTFQDSFVPLLSFLIKRFKSHTGNFDSRDLIVPHHRDKSR